MHWLLANAYVFLVMYVVCLSMCVVVKGVFIVAAKRTPFGSYGGKLMNFTTVDLQEQAFRAALAAGKVKPEWIDSVIVGNVFPVSDVYVVMNIYVVKQEILHQLDLLLISCSLKKLKLFYLITLVIQWCILLQLDDSHNISNVLSVVCDAIVFDRLPRMDLS